MQNTPVYFLRPEDDLDVLPEERDEEPEDLTAPPERPEVPEDLKVPPDLPELITPDPGNERDREGAEYPVLLLRAGAV